MPSDERRKVATRASPSERARMPCGGDDMTTVNTAESVVERARAATSCRGVHHLALNTEDMKGTVDFYVGVLGMKLVHAMRVPPGVGTGPGNRGNPPFENIRHYFFDMGNDSLLAFFELPKGAKEKGDRNAIAAMQHVAFAVTAKNAERIRARLQARGIPYQGPVEALPGLFSTYFFDPNGIRLEMATQPDDGDDIRIIRAVEQTKDDALVELRSLNGDETWLAQVTEHLA
jgi:catechol 2,3-dioxygenase-like lactoylglutathione lyase family enzyme